jgi:hypothetical protein
VSKHQKEDSTKRFVGISVKLFYRTSQLMWDKSDSSRDGSPHLEEYVAELLSNLHERVESTAVCRCTFRFEVVLLKRSFLPITPVSDKPCQLGL